MINAQQIYYDLVQSNLYTQNAEGSLQMANHTIPWSIKPLEFKLIYNTIIKNKLKRGYEIATAFGVSGLAASLAFKQTGGKLVTMDCYIEEQETGGDCLNYMERTAEQYSLPETSDGFKSAKYLIERFDLQSTMFLEIGWSPVDTVDRLSKHYDLSGGEKLDYVFIDAGHWDEAGIRDMNSVKDYLADGCHVFLHDMNGFGEPFYNYIKDTFNKDIHILLPYPYGYNMGLMIV